jgi:photosystem II stability/assembly factor-like uncharacterized protein
LKTTNSGYNWNIVLSRPRDFSKVMFLNLDTGYVLHGDEIVRTTNAGLNWNNIPVPAGNFGFNDMYPISYDTMWICFSYIGGDFIYRTTNAGLSWVRQLTGTSFRKIYFYNNNIGFCGESNLNRFIKTTNSGVNWTQIQGQNGWSDIFFIDSLNGWKSSSDTMKVTHDGGETWGLQYLPTGPTIVNYLVNFSNVNYDTLWGVGGAIAGNPYRGILYRTTNSGNNWSYQILDTSFHITNLGYIEFLNKNTGWSYSYHRNGIYTFDGGDTNFITNINTTEYLNPEDYKLSQNFPNPFNPVTIIKYEIKKQSLVEIKVFNILGVELKTLVKTNQQPGTYKIEFDGSNTPSGVYFYSMFINDNSVDTKKMMLIR